ncbi:MAG: 30S ribosomal protein S6 [Deltaproteobacteria bacterium RIFCSPLOWO2_02_FULL_44_10]|nr:MAG: 30S ribosomal protein S6 [Deltaproteobacteria bacterium RIFCSPHIGHO2_02_FULL_44_16]OGQ47092.1 MAG: 30S ribosomal protein S6 [Deltaproteobacteria bacterium RIFCSPLOWO2_02_FULL_44_10]
MREYETVYIASPELSQTQVAALNQRIHDIIEKQGGRLFYARDMGMRTLAYPIQKSKKGIYTCLDYAAQGDVVSQIERVLRLDETILRFLTVLKQDEIDVEARAAEIIARGEGESAPQTSTDFQFEPESSIPEEDE